MFWDLKDRNMTPIVEWEILKKSNVCKALDDPCFLCLQEKLAIIRFPDKRNLLNNKIESIGICRHRACLSLKYN